MRPAFSTARPVAALGPSVRLPAQDLAQIRFIVAAADMRANVRRRALLLSGRNAAAAAEAIAKELRCDLYRIDLAAVMSKFIGETEKNLERVFAEAGANGAVLLFDEADALFAKRTDVKDSHDRFANVQINLLLQRAERHRRIGHARKQAEAHPSNDPAAPICSVQVSAQWLGMNGNYALTRSGAPLPHPPQHQPIEPPANAAGSSGNSPSRICACSSSSNDRSLAASACRRKSPPPADGAG